VNVAVGMRKQLPGIALMLGNFVVGLAILLPAGMLHELSEGLGVSIPQAGLLVTYGAVVLCFASPLVAWATSRFDRRVLLGATLAILALCHLVSAFVPNYAALLTLRLIMLVIAAVYTPQAAGTVALIVSEQERPSAIAFVFLGWSLAVAGGLPLVTFVAAHLGWQATYGALAAVATVTCALLAVTLPHGLFGAPVSLRSWITIGHNRLILLLLLLTVLQASSLFVLFIYFAPLLSRLAKADISAIAALFAVYGVAGFVGNVIAQRIVTRLNPLRTAATFMASVLLGYMLWTFGAGHLPVMTAGVVLWGLGFAAVNSMQQARLVAAAPPLATASVALNTSSIYVGQAIGSGVAGLLFAHDHPLAMGYAAIAFMLAGFGVLAMTRGGKA
jgi:MFS transporter, DHA1 family, inner membrane transport protein